MMRTFDPLPNAPEPRRMTPEDAHSAVQARGAVLLDVRDARLFDNAHIDGALALPLAELDAWEGRLPPRMSLPDNALLILYCA